jgi:hypothetical protein
MTRLRIAFLLVAVVAGDYAALMLIDGQLIDFGAAAAICAGSSVAAGLIAWADDEAARREHELGRRRRNAVTRGRAAVWVHRDQQGADPGDRHCPLCGGARQKLSDSAGFVNPRGARLCGACAPASTQSRHVEPTAGLGAGLLGARTGAPREGGPRVACGTADPDAEVLT